MQRKRYDDAFKKGAVELVRREGYSIAKAAHNLGIDLGSIRRWIGKFPEVATVPVANPSQEQLRRENAQLREENRRLLMEREIFKKAATFFAKELT